MPRWSAYLRRVRPLAVFDIDGVLADVSHRVHFLDQEPADWSSFFAHAASDGTHAEGLQLLWEAATECDIAYLTGRPEWCRHDTQAWLRGQGLPEATLVMRRNGDHRPARLVKPTLLRALAQGRVVAVVVDDDLAVCDAYEKAGWTVLRALWASRSAALERAQEDQGRT